MKTNSPANYRLVGILGGMGPAATIDLMQKVMAATKAARDQDHVPLVVWNVPQIPERVAAIGDSSAPSPAPSPVADMCAGAAALANAGAEAIAIACNTAHYWAEEIEAAAGVPLIHIVDAALDELVASRINQRTMLLATEGTHKTGIYAERAAARGLNLETPDPEAQSTINDCIALTKAGKLADARELLVPRLVALGSSRVETFLLGCTELPLMVRGTPFEAQSLDATAALARAIVAFSLGTVVTTSHKTKRNPHLGDQVA
jgi:aspartate racemase